tara:strand:- start:358 stop:765 length:408 start_codon:yes stop_codon:yes gene_type:complete
MRETFMRTRFVLDTEPTLSDWNDFDTQVKELRRTAIADYATMLDGRERSEFTNDEYYNSQLKEYGNNFTISNRGSKYVKLINGGSVWGFVVKEDSDKFKRGDILKAASWNAPATNKARGNIFEEYTVQWTGPLYL